MKKRVTEQQIITILKEANAGVPLKELCRKYGMSIASYYKWKAKFGGMGVSEAQRLLALEAENQLNSNISFMKRSASIWVLKIKK